MKIEGISFESLRQCMGPEATIEEAGPMLGYIRAAGYTDTRDIPDAEWEEMCFNSADYILRNPRLGPLPKK